MNVKNNKQTNEKTKNSKCLPLHGIRGTAMLFVVASVVFSTFLVVTGTDNRVFWILCAPQALFAAYVLVYLTWNN